MSIQHFIGGLGAGVIAGVGLLAIIVIVILYIKYKKLKASLGSFFTEDCMTNLKQGLSWKWNLQSLPTPTETADYDQQTALFLTKAAAIASALHCSPSQWTTPPSFDRDTLVNLTIPGESIGYMIYSKATDVMMLIWRGTESQQDLILDIEFSQIPSGLTGVPGNVHSGFDSVLVQLADKITAFITKHTPSTIYVAGHSLGAGLTTLSGPWVAGVAAKSAQVRAYAFAPPDVGDPKFNAWAESLPNLGIYRFQNTADLVPTLPPGLPTEMYFELGTSYLYRKDTGTAGGNHGLITYRDAISRDAWLSTPTPPALSSFRIS